MANPYLDQLELPSGGTYDLRDQGARDLIAAINNWEYVVCSSAADTPKDITWVSGSTTITGTLVAASTTMYKIYLVPAENGTNDVYAEYITINPSGTTYKWEKFGNTKLPDMTQYVKNKSGHVGGTAGELGYKDTASGSTTVAVPKTYTTTTTTATTENKSVSVSGTTTGSVKVTKGVVDIKPNTTGTAANAYKPAGTNSASSVSGSCSVTPSGSISTGTGTTNYTPGGTVGTPTISVKTAGSTTTVKNPTSKTVVTDMSVANPSSTQATGELVYCSVTGTKLTLKKFVETTGDSITTENVTVKNGDAAYQSSQPTWTGTGVQLKFTGDSNTGTISGTAAAQTFDGTTTYLKTASDVATNASFQGASMTSTGSVAVPATFTSETETETTENKTVAITVS